jgi:hypothetical protein
VSRGDLAEKHGGDVALDATGAAPISRFGTGRQPAPAATFVGHIVLVDADGDGRSDIKVDVDLGTAHRSDFIL